VLVVGDDHADRPTAHDQRHVEACACADWPADAVVDLGVIEQGVDAFAAPAREDAAALRARRLQPETNDLLGVLAVGCGDREGAVGLWHGDREQTRIDEVAQAPCRQLQQARQGDFGRERVADLVERFELIRPDPRRLEQPRVLDCNGRLSGEEPDEVFVLGVEVGTALLLGEIEVPVGDAAQHHRDTEEAAHRRVVRGESDRAVVVVQIVETQSLRLVDQDTENASAKRKVADTVGVVGVDAMRDEAFEFAAIAVDDAERGISCPG
jgi:hypothetical protein